MLMSLQDEHNLSWNEAFMWPFAWSRSKTVGLVAHCTILLWSLATMGKHSGVLCAWIQPGGRRNSTSFCVTTGHKGKCVLGGGGL